MAMIWTRCWFDAGFGRGIEGLIFRFFSRPPEVEEYCHAFMVMGVLKDRAIVDD